MKVGDIVLYESVRWKVSSHSLQHRTCQLVAFDGSKREVPDDLGEPEIKVVYNPSEKWPFVASPVHARSGPLVNISRGDSGLIPMEDWVPSDFLRPGGSLFFNPKLRLRQGEVLVGTHQDGFKSRIAVTRAFGTIHRRKQRQAKPEKIRGPVNSMDRLLADDVLDED